MTDGEAQSAMASSPAPDHEHTEPATAANTVGMADTAGMTSVDAAGAEVADRADASGIPPAGRRPRRLLRRWLWALAIVVVLLIVADLGGGWYFSGQLLVPDHSVSYRVTVKAVNGNEVTLTRDVDTVLPGIRGLIWADGSAILDGSVRLVGGSVVRTVTTMLQGELRPGLHARMEAHVWDSDPKVARGLDFTVVSVHDELGDMPAWLVTPTAATARSTWVIGVHGYGSNRGESLRILPTIAAAGMPALVISYRNDIGAPKSPGGFYHLGDSEWKDVMAAIEYARGQGATGVILYGWSMGGGAVLTSLHRMPAADTGFVQGVVLDSPAVDWTATVDLAGGQKHLPGMLTWTAERISEARTGFSLPALNQRKFETALTVPTLMFVDLSDTTVPAGPSLQFAHARADLVTLITTNGGDHTGSWNMDPSGYESAVRDLLNRVG
jgi:dienelactone hydrolase